MTTIVYGLKNCDTCRKALRWLDSEGHAHQFIDIRTDTPAAATLADWVDAVGLTALINRRSTTWRQLDDATRDSLDEDKAPALLLAHPTLVKRPVLVTADSVSVGFDVRQWADLLA